MYNRIQFKTESNAAQKLGRKKKQSGAWIKNSSVEKSKPKHWNSKLLRRKMYLFQIICVEKHFTSLWQVYIVFSAIKDPHLTNFECLLRLYKLASTIIIVFRSSSRLNAFNIVFFPATTRGGIYILPIHVPLR